VDVVVNGRNVEVPEHFRIHVGDKLHRLERYDNKIIEVNVELLHERNPRQSDSCQRIEITCVSRGPVVRAEACAGDFYAALERAIDKLEARLRRAADRRRVHYGRRAPASLAVAATGLAATPEQVGPVAAGRREAEHVEQVGPVAAALREAEQGEPADDGQPWHIARTKEHPAAPMTVDDALFEMELVGHDFYLFLDKDSGRPSVVYRRHKGYDYGVISLAA